MTSTHIRAARSLATALGVALLAVGASFAQAQAPQVTGRALPGLETFDAEILRILQTWKIPGASLAVAKDGKLVLAKGYGLADREAAVPMRPDTLFRMGSITKTVTAVAVLKLAQEKKLSLDDAALPLLAKAGVAPAKLADPRAQGITIRQLLQHSAGMDREKSGDPFFMPLLRDVSRRQGSSPVTCPAIIKDTLERPLDFAPGERFAYSNTGYCMLGRVVEAASGEPFARYVSRAVVGPAIQKDYVMGKTLERLPQEARYHPYPGQANSVAAPGITAPMGVEAPYGSYSIENMDALGAWVATPTDVLKFFLAIDGARGERILSADTMREMLTAPAHQRDDGTRKTYRGLGVEVLRTEQGTNWWHTGRQPSVVTLALRSSGGFAWVLAFNSRPPESDRVAFLRDYDQALWRAARAVRNIPEGDLF